MKVLNALTGHKTAKKIHKSVTHQIMRIFLAFELLPSPQEKSTASLEMEDRE
jgi:hypothetical protein